MSKFTLRKRNEKSKIVPCGKSFNGKSRLVRGLSIPFFKFGVVLAAVFTTYPLYAQFDETTESPETNETQETIEMRDTYEVIRSTQPRMVKIFGAGGLRRLEAYQTGVFISPEGHVLTAYGYVINTDSLYVALNDGRRFQAEMVGADPRLEIAVLKIQASDTPYFSLTETEESPPGTPILAFTNLFGLAVGDEPCSVQQGIIATKTSLSGRRGTYETPYQGPIYVLDAITSNPGSAGGAVVDYEGRLLALIGKELQDVRTNVWLNYAIPIRELKPSVLEILKNGASVSNVQTDHPETRLPDQYWTLEQLGLRLVPDVLLRTPPYVDVVQSDGLADAAGLLPDDLLVQVEGRIVPTVEEVKDALRRVDVLDPLEMAVLRDDALIEIEFAPQR